jgi:hypothetical protein
MDAPVVEEVREVVRGLPQPTTVRDIHLWRVGKGTVELLHVTQG